MIRRLAFASLALGIALGLAGGMIVAPSVAHAQGFHAIHSPDGVDIWAVGDGGVIYRSTNSGADYFSTSAGSGPLRSVATQGLVALVTADNGLVWRSVNGGGAWTSQTLAGSPHLYGVAFPTPATAYVVGAGGAIWKSIDGGVSWTQQFSSTAAALRAVRFTDDQNGWAVGDGGVVRHTVDGGSNWAAVTVPSPNRLRAIDVLGSTIWIVGERGTCMRSVDGGTNWAHVNLKLDTRSAVRAVHLVAPDTVWVAGGGGFVRRSGDGGATWTWMQHKMHGALSGLSVVGNRAHFSSSKHRTVFRTANGGITWTMPSLASMSQTFVSKFIHSGNARGSTIVQSPADENTFYAAVNNFIHRSRDAGDTWQYAASFPTPEPPATGYSKCNAFLISPKDTNLWIAAVGGNSVSDRLLRTTNGGASWDTVLIKDFGEYGIPLEMHPDNPDTLYFGGDFSRLWRSTNFGATWIELGSDSLFRSPCDIVVVPDSANIILVGDGVTGMTNPPGQYYKSVDGGLTFALMASRQVSGASEIPGMACSRQRNSAVVGTNWSAGGVQRSLDYGTTWPSTNNAGAAWGVDIARDDPNVPIFALYSGNAAHISYDGGAIWNQITVNMFGASNGLFARDREVILAEQSGAYWKMLTTYPFVASSTQSVSVSAPNGGEEWVGGTVRNVTWTQLNVAVVRIEYQKSPADAWQFVADVSGATSSYAWSVPYDDTYEAKIRVRDAWDLNPTDASDATFAIATAAIAADPVAVSFGAQPRATATTLAVTIENTGVGTLFISNVTTSDGAFTEGRTAFSIPPAGSDTIGVTFRPGSGVNYGATLDITSNALGSPVTSVPLDGSGLAEQFAAYPGTLALGPINPGATARDTIHIDNLGTNTLTIMNVTSDHPEFYPSRTALTIPAGMSDTIRISSHPLGGGSDAATISILASDTTLAHEIPVTGDAVSNVAVAAPAPPAFALAQNQPNPFGRATQIRYALPIAADVTLEVFNLQGRRVATLVRAFQSPGWYTVPFGRGAEIASGARVEAMPSGVYFYRLHAGSFTSTRKMLYVR